MWILKQEEARRNGRIFISKHNGHVKKSGNYDANNKVMGNLLVWTRRVCNLLLARKPQIETT